MSTLCLSPHDDDSVLFTAFTCLREKPIVVICTDAYVQSNRGEIGCDAETRANESLEAHKILGCPIIRLGVRDDIVNENILEERLKKFQNFDKVYAPALQGGSPHHDMVSKVAKRLFKNVIFYTTYTPTELWTKGNTEVMPTKEEQDLKEKALLCYTSQINLPATKPHFEAIKGKSEFLI